VRLLAFWLLLSFVLCACAARTASGTDAALRSDGAVLDYRDIPASAPQAATNTAARPLLLITGYAVTKEMWNADFVQALAAQRRVLLLDNRGMGRGMGRGDTTSSQADDASGIPGMARDAAALLDALGIVQADVLGWSMGGMAAQELALTRPDLVASLTLYATAPDTVEIMPVLDRMAAMSGPELRAAFFPQEWAQAHPGAVDRLPKHPRPPDMGVIARQYAAMRGWPGCLDRLSGLGMPVLLLAGENDWVCPAKQSRRMAARIPGSELVVLPGGGHWMMHQFPTALARLVDDFITSNTLSQQEKIAFFPLARPAQGLRP